MRDTGNISQYRSRLDETLSSNDLINDDMLKTLVKNQIRPSSESDLQECSDNVVHRRTKEVANFLSMLRSASVTDGGWKVKQDTEEIRIMYREGPEGTPYHTVLAEGYVDAPVDVCLCISWEAELYKKWWPQITIPTFKIEACQCLQKERTSEQICLVRMKLSRPLSAREALVHFFTFEYFQDDLIVVLANSISDIDSIDRSTHGYSKDGIPQPQDVVRVDLAGGFALQKVTENRSYFRTIGNLDIKLDFFPPALINFVARQVIGSGFNLYKKEVASVVKGDEDFSKVLKDPLYARIREALYPTNLPNCDGVLELRHLTNSALPLNEKPRPYKCLQPKVHSHRDNCVVNSPLQENFEVRYRYVQGEIEEIEDETCEKIERLNEDDRNVHDSLVNQLVQKPTKNKNVGISPEAKQALVTLEKAISILREHRCNLEISTVPDTTVNSAEAEVDSRKASKSSEADTDRRNIGDSYEHRNSSGSHGSRRTSSSLCTRAEGYHNKIAPASPRVYAANISGEANHIARCSSTDQTTGGTIRGRTSDGDNVTFVHTNGIDEKDTRDRRRKLRRYCCLYFLFRQVVA